MAMDYEDYEAVLRIDKEDLDGELEKNPKTFLDVSNEFARAVSRRDQLKDDLKVVEAKLQLRVRREAEANGEGKLTEALATAKVNSHPKRAKAVSRYLKACEEAQRWENLKDALKDRGFALRELGNLYVSGYWGEVSVRSGNRREVEERLHEGRRRIISQEKRKQGKRGYAD